MSTEDERKAKHEAMMTARNAALDKLRAALDLAVAEIELHMSHAGHPMMKQEHNDTRRAVIFVDAIAEMLMREHRMTPAITSRRYDVMLAALIDCLHVCEHKFHDHCIDPEELMEAVERNYKLAKSPLSTLVDLVKSLTGADNVTLVEIGIGDEVPAKAEKAPSGKKLN